MTALLLYPLPPKAVEIKGFFIAVLWRAVTRRVGHVLADKPWIISLEDLPKLQAALDTADANRVIAYDIMTERHEITSIRATPSSDEDASGESGRQVEVLRRTCEDRLEGEDVLPGI